MRNIICKSIYFYVNSQLIYIIHRNFSSPVCKIDLHGLHIQEAVSLLEKFLYDKKLEIKRRLHPTPIVVTVITGQGRHSAQGAKLRPAVLNYLKSSKYRLVI